MSQSKVLMTQGIFFLMIQVKYPRSKCLFRYLTKYTSLVSKSIVMIFMVKSWSVCHYRAINHVAIYMYIPKKHDIVYMCMRLLDPKEQTTIVSKMHDLLQWSGKSSWWGFEFNPQSDPEFFSPPVTPYLFCHTEKRKSKP